MSDEMTDKSRQARAGGQPSRRQFLQAGAGALAAGLSAAGAGAAAAGTGATSEVARLAPPVEAAADAVVEAGLPIRGEAGRCAGSSLGLLEEDLGEFLGDIPGRPGPGEAWS